MDPGFIGLVGRLATSTALTMAVVFLRESIVVRRFGPSAAVDAFYLSLAPLTLSAGVFLNVAEARFVPLFARSPKARHRLIESFATRGGIGVAFAWLASGAALAILLRNTHLASLGSMLIVEAVAIVPAARFAVARGALLAIDRLWEANLAAAGGTLVAVVAILLSQSPSQLPLAVVAGFVVQWLLAEAAYRRHSASGEAADTAVGTGILGLSMAMLVTTSGTTVDRVVASFLGSGAITGIAVADRVYQLPATLAAATLASAIFPRLARRMGPSSARTTSQRAFSLNIAVTVPAGAVLAICAGDAVRLVAGQSLAVGNVELATEWALRWLALAIPFYTTSVLLVRILLAYGRESVVIWQAVLALASNLALDVLGAHFWGLAGIGAATLGVFIASDLMLLILVPREIAGVTAIRLLLGANPSAIAGWAVCSVLVLVALGVALPSGTLRLAGTTLTAAFLTALWIALEARLPLLRTRLAALQLVRPR